MEAVLFTYDAKKLDKSTSSKTSKKLIGYKDKSNKGHYIYNREGLIQANEGIIISKSTFIIPKKNAKKVFKSIKVKGLEISKWNIILKTS